MAFISSGDWMSKDWIGVDLDKTLARYESGDYKRFGPLFIGEPIQPMVNLVKEWIAAGEVVKIFTARVGYDPDETKDISAIVNAIQDWTEKHIGYRLEVTNQKTGYTKAIYDDKAFGVLPNEGIVIIF